MRVIERRRWRHRGRAVSGGVLCGLLLGVCGGQASATQAPVTVGGGGSPGAARAALGWWTSANVQRVIPRRLAAPGRRRAHSRDWRTVDPTPKPRDMRPIGMHAIGRLFSHRPDGSIEVCSASLVDSANRSLVWTAGHCVHSGRGGAFYSDFVFVPYYQPQASGNSAPLGQWPGVYWATTADWASRGDGHHFGGDVGVVVLARDAQGRTATDVVGASQHIAFGRTRSRSARLIGFPMAPRPFGGELPFACGPGPTGRVREPRSFGPRPFAIRCGMRQGTSGGPLLAGIHPDGIGTIISVYSVFSYQERNVVYTPIQSTAARRLYREYSSKAV